ncbi:MAG: hypothetical protein WB643_03390 [Candidatus Bathyarchaeia archaeon]
MKWMLCKTEVGKILENAFEIRNDWPAFTAQVEAEIASFIHEQWGLEPD